MDNPNTQKAIALWMIINERAYTNEIEEWIEILKAGNADWFRNFGLLNIALSNQCRFGRIGFNEEKYEKLQQWALQVLRQCGLQIGAMQN